MKMLAASAIVFALLLGQVASPALADKDKGGGSHAPEQGAKPHKPHPSSTAAGTRTRGPERAVEVHRKQDNDNDGDGSAEPEHEDEGKIGICHATGNGSYVFIRVSENARGHLEHHVDDILDATGPESCPDTVADAD